MALDPITIAALASASTQIGQSGANALLQGKTNRKTRKWNEKMYQRQREDNLADWAMQNDYNSPQAQMERYRKAGLNPNLIYGQSNEAAPVKSADSPSWNPRAPEIDLNVPQMFAGYMDARVKEAQIDNLRAGNTVALQEAALKAAQTHATVVNTKGSEISLKYAEQNAIVSLQKAQAELDKLKTDTYVTISRNEREAATNTQNLQEGAERILNLRVQRAKTEEEKREIEERIKSIRADETLKNLDIELKRNGIQPHDAIWWRILGRLLGGESIKDLLPK